MAGTRWLSLVGRVFLVAFLPVLLLVGATFFATRYLGARFAEPAATKALDNGHSLLSSLLERRRDRLALAARLVAQELDLDAPPTSEEGSAGPLSVFDQLRDQQEALGFDLGLLLEVDGRVTARSDKTDALGEDLSQLPLVARVREEEQPTFGIWTEEETLASAVAMPILRDFDLAGFLVLAYRFDRVLALETARTTNSEVAFLVATPTGPAVSATTLGPPAVDDLILSLRAQGALSDVLSEVGERLVELEGKTWRSLLAPLRDALELPVGAIVVLAPGEAGAVALRQVEWVVLGAGAVALVLSTAFALLLSRGGQTPVKGLLQAVEAAIQGNRGQRIQVKDSGQMGRLAQALDGLLEEMRQEKALATFLDRAGPQLHEGAGALASAPRAGDVALLAVELRRFANPRITFDPEQTLSRLGKDVRQALASITKQGGRLDGISGHRILASFEGEGRALRALCATCELIPQLLIQESAFDEVEPPAVALVSGDLIHGPVAVGEAPQNAILGLPVQQIDSLLREATPGDIFISQKVYQELVPALEQAGVEMAPHKALMSTQPMYLLSSELASWLTGIEADAPKTVAVTTPNGATPAAEIAPGVLVAERYQILAASQVGRGLGASFLARDQEMSATVLVKVLQGAAWEGPMERDRLRSELGRASRVSHSNVARILDFGELQGLPFVVTEPVLGPTLQQLLDQTRLVPLPACLCLARQLCAGLASAHSEGLPHRGIQPGSVVVELSGRLKLLDLGLVPAAQGEEAQPVGGLSRSYKAPEQLSGQPPDARSDVYLCGVLFYEMLTGQLPQSGDPGLASEVPPPSAQQKGLPEALDRIILKCLERQPDRRYTGAAGLWKDLSSLRSA